VTRDIVLLGDEAVALAAMHAGVTAAFAYPGTPSTEILEYFLRHPGPAGRPRATWCANEKTAYEAALGVSLVGRRALVAMKHVGLNVAADPFINSVLVAPHGGLVVAVADDPGMHSSQNEQDTRFYADFARTICFEPATQQEAYDMTREAFDVAERFRVPVVLRLVTRLAHSRAVVHVSEPPRDENVLRKAANSAGWILLPDNARQQWHAHLERFPAIDEWSHRSTFNTFSPGDPTSGAHGLGVITAGLARNYYLENAAEFGARPPHLHIGTYPVPRALVAQLVGRVDHVLVLEDGYPFVERALRGLLPDRLGFEILGRSSGHIPPDGELTPDFVRAALGLPERRRTRVGWSPPARPPQLCAGCPHIDTLAALTEALAPYRDRLVTSDIGCYTLGALPPYSAVESCVCMGASIGMAIGAARAGMWPVVALIGDSTFLHSGVTPLIDAVSSNVDMTVIVMDNEVVAMTGGQPTILPSSRLAPLVTGLGVAPAHCHVLPAHPRHVTGNAAILRQEIEHRGLSVIISVRECVETARARKKSRTSEAASPARPEPALAIEEGVS
jgi:indolepyruvate ferredoxin oxidoreductase alpha subunit